MKKYSKLFTLVFALTLTLGLFVPMEMVESQEHHQAKETTGRHCIALCSFLPSEGRLEDVFEKEDNQPQPIAAEPYYYVAFLSSLYAATIGLALLFTRHLRWRPPDLSLRYANLRF